MQRILSIEKLGLVWEKKRRFLRELVSIEKNAPKATSTRFINNININNININNITKSMSKLIMHAKMFNCDENKKKGP